MEDSIASVFSDTLSSITGGILRDYEAGVTADHIADEVDLDDLNDLIKDLPDNYRAIFTESANKQLGYLEIDEEDIFDLVHADAVAYAETRSAQLIGKKILKDGSIVDNPSAKWAITDSTRESIRSTIEQAYTDGSSPAELKIALQESYGFSSARSKLIAKTETSLASSQGSLTGWKRSGLVKGKSSILSEDHDIDDECNENEDAGVIPVDEDFPSGDDAPPYHPGCNCTVIAELIEGDEDTNDSESDE